jgi:hypothetical protein
MKFKAIHPAVTEVTITLTASEAMQLQDLMHVAEHSRISDYQRINFASKIRNGINDILGEQPLP